MISKELVCEELLFKFITDISKWYGKDLTDCVLCFADGVELHYHDDGGSDDEKEEINS